MGRSLPDDWESRRRDVISRDNYTCQNCGRTGGPLGATELHVHHIVPKAKGGTHRLSNLKTVCNECHKAIHGDSDAPTAKPQGGKYGTKKGHILIAALTGWWTLGIGNLLYALYRRSKWKNKLESQDKNSSGLVIEDYSFGDEPSMYQWLNVNSFRREALLIIMTLYAPVLVVGPAFAVLSSIIALIALPILYLWRQRHPLPYD